MLVETIGYMNGDDKSLGKCGRKDGPQRKIHLYSHLDSALFPISALQRLRMHLGWAYVSPLTSNNVIVLAVSYKCVLFLCRYYIKDKSVHSNFNNYLKYKWS